MNEPHPRFILAAALCALLGGSGCAWRRAPAPLAPPGPPPPQAPAPGPPPLPPPASGSEPVYLNPRIGMVILRAHEDAQGRLLGPQVMYEVIEPGGWNLDAVENGRGYIPSVNAESAPAPGPAGAPPLGGPLLDPASAAAMIITGLMSPADRPAAEEMARKKGRDWTAVYDREAGWLLAPGPAPAAPR